MQTYFQRFIFRSLMAIALVMALLAGWVAWDIQPVHADIRQFEESADQVIYESRTKLYDSNNHIWRAIAFNRTDDEGNSSLQLRIVGNPNSEDLLHPHPLVIRLPEGDTIEVADVSDESFMKDSEGAPVGNVGQYDLDAVIHDIPDKMELFLSLPTPNGEEIRLAISPLDIQEWKALAEPA